MKATVKSTSNKTPYAVFFGICALLVVYFAVSGGNQGGLNASGGSDPDGGDSGSVGSTVAGGGVTRPTDDAGGSIFDSDVFLAGRPTNPIQDPKADKKLGPNDEPDVLDPADKDNPKNPQTGRPYSNSSMKQFAALRKRFPNNSIIPRKKTPEQIKQEKDDRMKMFALQSQVVTGKASPEEINKYYEFRTRPVRDRVELLSYVVDKYRDRMAPNVKAQYEKILIMNRKVLENHEKAKQKALEKSNGGE